MERLEKIQLAIEKGITCDIEIGKVYGVRGNELITKNASGYLIIALKNDKKLYVLYQHQFIYYIATGKIVEYIDHINEDKSDNRIENLRSVTRNQNQYNKSKSKGYYWNKKSKRWLSRIKLNNKDIYLGYFDIESEAREAYLNAKKIYHII